MDTQVQDNWPLHAANDHVSRLEGELSLMRRREDRVRAVVADVNHGRYATQSKKFGRGVEHVTRLIESALDDPT